MSEVSLNSLPDGRNAVKFFLTLLSNDLCLSVFEELFFTLSKESSNVQLCEQVNFRMTPGTFHLSSIFRLS